MNNKAIISTLLELAAYALQKKGVADTAPKPNRTVSGGSAALASTPARTKY